MGFGKESGRMIVMKVVFAQPDFPFAKRTAPLVKSAVVDRKSSMSPIVEPITES